MKSIDIGATPTTAMTHIAIQGQLEDKVVEWSEKICFAVDDDKL